MSGQPQRLVSSQAALRALVDATAAPALFLDLDAFDRNRDQILTHCRLTGKRMRIASKSIRCPELMRRIQSASQSVFQGLLTYSVRESVALYQAGFRDLVVAYPSVSDADFREAAALLREDVGAITFMVDSAAHLEFLRRGRSQYAISSPLSVAIDADMSFRPLGIHVGVQRSSVRTLEEFQALVQLIRGQAADFQLRGVMGYEAQIAGLPEQNPFSPLLNPAKAWLKARSAKDVSRKRAAIADWLHAEGLTLDFFNGGGTGSLTTTALESWLTEMTAGSGFFQSHLFDYYATNRLEPALFFALPVTRVPAKGIITCHGGGFIASGESGPDRAPIPVFPAGLRSISTEGFGEVQTPFRVPSDVHLEPGDFVLCRPAKAGEIAERFETIQLVSSGQVVGGEKTYRGLGWSFH